MYALPTQYARLACTACAPGLASESAANGTIIGDPSPRTIRVFVGGETNWQASNRSREMWKGSVLMKVREQYKVNAAVSPAVVCCGSVRKRRYARTCGGRRVVVRWQEVRQGACSMPYGASNGPRRVTAGC